MQIKYIVVAAQIGLLLTSIGCKTVTGLKTPKSLSLDGPISKFSTETFQQYLQDYTTAMEAKDYAHAQVLRDRMINGIRVEIEMNYREFEQKLYAGRAAFNTTADIAELALAGAATITHGESAKTIISGVLTAVKGGRLSYDKNFFREKTTEAIIASMQAGRSTKLAHIIESMNVEVQRYPFEEAWADLVDFFYAGTIEGGLLALTSDAGNKAEAGKRELKAAERVRLLKATAVEIKTTGELTDEVGKLVKAEDQAAARARAEKILKELGVRFDANETNMQLYEKLQDQINAATTDRSLLPKLSRAFR